ncbi:MAG: chitinase [Myxococcales bacterium]|nr:chitinase [Myxococcales bacterium]
MRASFGTGSTINPRRAVCSAIAALLFTSLAGCSGSVGSTGSDTDAPLSSTGTIVDFTGLCVDVQWAGTASGTPVQLWDCNGTAAQKWTMQGNEIVGLANKCLDVSGGNSANGTPVQLWDCNGTGAQKWSYSGGQLIGVGGKCLDVSGANSVPGQQLQIWDCHGGANQQFKMAGGETPPPPPPATGDLAAAKAFMKPLGLGFNIERGWAWSVPGGPRAEAQYLASLGVTHVRLFFPWSPTVNYGGLGFGVPSEQQMRTFFDGVAAWVDGGMTVFLDCADELDTDDFDNHRDTVYEEVRRMAAVAATYNFPKDRVAIGPVNEWVGDDGNGGDPYMQARKDLHAILRQALPGYVLTVSSEYWDYYRNLEKLQPFADQRVIYSFHAYEQHSPADWQGAAVNGITDWSRRNGGLPVLMGEAGPYGADESSFVGDLLPAMAVFRPTLWAITYGGALRWNKSPDDATLKDGSNGTADLRGAVIRAAQAARGALGGNDGAP